MFIIAGLYRRQRLKSPKGEQTRPTSSRLREALFNICQHSIEGARFLDIFAGSGAMGFEALSRGAQSATFIDVHKEAIHCIESNMQHLNVQAQCQILRGEALVMLQMLKKHGKQFDIIYADPPYRTVALQGELLYSSTIIRWVDTHEILVPGGQLFIEEDFQYQPQMDDLKKLALKDSRRLGNAALQRYERVT